MEILANSAALQRDLGEYIREKPLTALAIATMAGFVFGGGVNRRIGLAMLTTIGPMVFRGVGASLIAGILTSSPGNGTPDGARPGDGRHDNGRTDFQEPG